ncbi:MAG: zinc metalloprotease HtpX [Candidatus Micrarchaeaceae archaeon]
MDKILLFKLKMYFAIFLAFLIGSLALFYIFRLFAGASSELAIFYILLLILPSLFIQYAIGPYLIGAMYRLKEVKEGDEYDWLKRIVSKVASSNGVKVPRIYIANVNFMNAFAYGNIFSGPRVAITLPFLKRLDKDEIEAVLGHEIGHIRHKDVGLIMALGIVPTLVFWFGYSISMNMRRNAYLFLFGILITLFSFLYELFVIYVNRQREAYEDINSVKTTGKPNSLITALAKIELENQPAFANRQSYFSNVSSMLMFSPVRKKTYFKSVEDVVAYWRSYKVRLVDEIFSDHPHPANRLKLIESAAGIS